MTSSNSHLRRQARLGYVNAIATLLNQSLHRQNCSATVERQEKILKIVITGKTEAPDPAIAARIQRGLLQIRPAMTHQAVIYGQRAGDISPQWSETVSLVSPATTATAAPTTTETATSSSSSSAREEKASADNEQQAALSEWVKTHCPVDVSRPRPRPQQKLTPRILRLLAWEVAVLSCAFAPIVIYLISTQGLSRVAQISPDLMAQIARRHVATNGTGLGLLSLTPLALIVFVFCIRPLALQEGTVLATQGRWRPSYGSAVIIHLVVLILMAIINSVIIQPLIPTTPIARWVLFGLTEVGLYGSILRLPSSQSQGWWWPTCGAVLFMEVVTQLPLRLMAPVLNEFAARLELFRIFF